ncbi:hypothetical protein RHGRI_019460 [Rhododendron griersonianum]|uniref:Disease resistance RPP13-like protein 1 n=1 Tax=Rhododendron griersonianum TaxID=479676 RepID=A0AAV6JCN5_9ERIC|nr:hypothetical protein RHGRI_019460 [Rhododendron griersonianum]
MFDRLASPELMNFFRGRKHDESLLDELKLELIELNKVLNDAEVKQITDRAVKEWLEELTDAVYDADDLLDEIATKGLRCKVEAEYQSGLNLVRSLIWIVTSLFDYGVESELEKIINKLGNLEKAKDVLGLGKEVGQNWSRRLPTTSLVDESYAKDLELLQVKLKGSLSGKKFLIVLDDVWNENYDHWDILMTPFGCGAHGSKIIVTTRNESVASIVQTVPIHGLKHLPEEDCWNFFSIHTFEKGDCNAYPHLEKVGKQIVRKCRGLPLADWNNVLKSALWELPDEKSNILLALTLSYHHLPSHLKRCFAYCSIFIKDYEFDMKELISIWIAEGILKKPKSNYEKPKSNKTVEEEGYECFHQLLSRSFFQRSKANNDLFVMHDLVHDFAQNVTGDFCYRLEDGMLNGISEKVRHFSYVQGKFDGFDKLKVIKDAKCLRTFLPIGSRTSGKQWLSKKVLDEILSGLTRLRFLSLARYQIVELPYSIGNLIHLRFLDLSDTLISLQNVTGGSDALEAKLREKKHLEKLVLEWGSTTDDSQNKILENLEPHTNLKHLKLTIARMLGTTNVGIEFYGESGSLSKPFQSLETLRFEEMSEWVDWCILDAGVFPQLQKLEVIRCPKLIGDLPKGHSLVRLKIKECPELVASLPRITSMRELVLQECQGLLLEWQGISSLEIVKISSFASNFASELLTLTNLKQLKVSWCPKLVFPLYCYTSLERLSFSECESLKSLPLGLFPKLRSLEINSCVNFENLLLPNEIELQNLPLLETLYIRFCDNMVSFPGGGLPAPNLSDLWVCYCKKLKTLPKQMRTLPPSLQRLIVWICPEIESFPEGGLPSKLHVLWIWNCKKLVGSRRDWGLQTLPYLSTFTREGESEDVLESIPEEGLLPSTLTKLEIGDLKNLKSLNKRGLELLDSLEAMEIRNCPQLKSLPDEGLPTTLSELLIEDCPSLKSRCRREEGEDWYKVAHIPGIIMDDEVIFDHKYPGPPESAGPSVSFSEVYPKFQ